VPGLGKAASAGQQGSGSVVARSSSQGVRRTEFVARAKRLTSARSRANTASRPRTLVTVTPSSTTGPLVGGTRPATQRKSVDLPHSDGPAIVTAGPVGPVGPGQADNLKPGHFKHGAPYSACQLS